MAREFSLPAGVIGPADVARLKRNLEFFDEQERAIKLRAKANKVNADAKHTTAAPSEPSKQLQALAAANDCDLLVAAQREGLLASLQTVLDSAPTVTMSFAVDPSAAFMTKIVSWLRTTIDPLLLVRIGLQPNIAAGCTLRTPSKIYDFSLRSKFTAQRPMLLQRLSAATQPQAEITAPKVEAS